MNEVVEHRRIPDLPCMMNLKHTLQGMGTEGSKPDPQETRQTCHKEPWECGSTGHEEGN